MNTTQTGSETMTKKLVNFKVDGAWRPVSESFGPDDTTAEYTAFVSRYVVVSALGTLFHGKWADEKGAKVFANSMPRIPEATATVAKVAPYWYAPVFGKVS